MVSCKKLVDIPPPVGRITDNTVFTNDETAINVVTGIYNFMNRPGVGLAFTGNAGISIYAGLAADEFTLYSGVTETSLIGYYRNALYVTPTVSIGSQLWSPLFNYIYKVNASIEGITASQTLTPFVKQQLLGEAKFLRALYYFYLVNFFGDVPLVLTTDYKTNALLGRASTAEVYQQIVFDLKEAQELLSPNYVDGSLMPYVGSVERVRPNKWVATALLARTYLYIGDYSSAEIQATSIINNSLYSLSDLNRVFLKNSSEAIWQLQPVITGHNTEDGWTFILPPNGPSNVNNTNGNPVYLSSRLLNSFESNDMRKENWVSNVTVSGTTYFYPNKYKSSTLNAVVTEYFMLFRLAEQYLIRAEARANLNLIDEAKRDLDVIRTRAGLVGTTANDKASLIIAILSERQKELFTELGHRWLDLKRTSNIDGVMNSVTPLKANGSTWQSYQQWFPLPQSELDLAPNLVQNVGY